MTNQETANKVVSPLNASTARNGHLFRSWIDQPSTTALSSTRLVIRGWCYHRGAAPIRAVRARIGARIFPGATGDSRPDVHAAFGGERGSDKSGYEIAAAFPGGASVCRLEAQLEDEAWHEFQTFSVTAPRAAAWRAKLTWAQFWFTSWRGKPAAWDALSREDQDFVLASARHRGWLNLELAPRLAPRPVASEQFPRSRTASERLPKITVVTPSFQHGSFLEPTLRSVLDQPGVRLDYIVQDGGSNDGSVDIIRRHASRLKHWESVRDHGQADAIARGFAHMDCGPDDVMAYLNSDDLLLPGAARFVAEYFAKHPETDVVYGHRVVIDEAGREVNRWFTPRPAFDDLRTQDLIPQETLFWRRRIWDRVGGIDRSFRFAMDWDLLLRFHEAGARFARLPWFLGAFRLHPQQKSQAWMSDVGVPEMDRVRERALGRRPSAEALHASMRRAQFDSALVCALWQRNRRL